MKSVTSRDITHLSLPPSDSHKGQNGRLLLIGGSHLFHASSLWALEVASRIVDLVHYASVPENNELVMKIKSEFHDGIIIPRSDLDAYIEEDDAILIGPGMTRDNETKELTDGLLRKYPQKQWVIDAGALQMMDISLIPKNAILTPHHGEFERLKIKNQESNLKNTDQKSQIEETISNSSRLSLKSNQGLALNGLALNGLAEEVQAFAETYHCIVLLKGPTDIVCPPTGGSRTVAGGNPGMTKGGTGDVLAGLVAALACKNDPFLAAIAASFINKKAGDALYKTVGSFFNASDLANQIPLTMKALFFG